MTPDQLLLLLALLTDLEDVDSLGSDCRQDLVDPRVDVAQQVSEPHPTPTAAGRAASAPPSPPSPAAGAAPAPRTSGSSTPSWG